MYTFTKIIIKNNRLIPKCLVLVMCFSLIHPVLFPEMGICCADTGNLAERSDARKVAETFIRELSAIQTAVPLHVSVVEIHEIKGKTGASLAYVADLDPSGFILIAPSRDIEPVLGYSLTGRFPTVASDVHPLKLLLMLDIEGRLNFLSTGGKPARTEKQRANELWYSYTAGISARKLSVSEKKVWGPLLKTSWHQGSPYNDFCPLYPGHSKRSAVGCSPLATAQIFNYWRYPERYTFDSDDAYEPTWNMKKLFKIPDDSEKFSFPGFDEMNEALVTVRYEGDVTETAYLCFAVGIKMKTIYGTGGSPTTINTTTLIRLGYTSTLTGDWPESRDAVIDDMKNGWPVMMSVGNDTSGHAVVVDGYDASLNMFHVNLGWGDDNNTWYSLPSIITYDKIARVYYHITPHHGAEEPSACSIIQNMPNPFNAVTIISYSLPSPSSVTLSIYNVQGQKIRTLVHGSQIRGRYSYAWNARDDDGRLASSGVYFYRLTTPDYQHTRRMMLVR